ncbi:MAG TPA: hypothetical protein VG944_15640, partial [Fimbriimonas sp.]|nr:hypothetical protein [Fimbriimonas sp.]
VAQPFVEIGRATAQRVLERIATKGVQPSRQIFLDAPLIIRESTGVPFANLPSSKLPEIGGIHEKPQSVHSY